MSRTKTVLTFSNLLHKRARLSVSSLSEYINLITAINGDYKKVYYRGQSDKTWEITSSAYRALTKKDKPPTQKQLRAYHLALVNDVKKLHDGELEKHEGVQLLVHLQHYGADTTLIDYSLNPLVALWFACSKEDKKGDKEEETDGTVYGFKMRGLIEDGIQEIIENKDVTELFKNQDDVFVFDPPYINRRITSQQSVFLIGANGKLDKEKHITIHVSKNNKKQILDQLALAGISEKTLFPDFTGFIKWFSYSAESQMDLFNDKVQKAMERYYDCAYNDALSLFDAAIEIGENELKPDDPILANAYNNIARVHRTLGHYDDALTWNQKALKIRESVLGKDHPDTAMTYNNIAVVYEKQGEYSKALEWDQKALDIRESVLGKDHPDTAVTYNNIAIVYDDQGEYKNALEWYQKALDIRESVLGKDHPDTASTYNNIAGVYKKQGEYLKALEGYQKALDIYEKVLGKDHPHTAMTYNNIAGVYHNQGEYKNALEGYQKALEIHESVLGKDHPYTAITYNNIAAVYHNQGEYSKALPLYIKALKIRKTVLGSEHPYCKNTYNNMRLSYKSSGETRPFEEWLREQLGEK